MKFEEPSFTISKDMTGAKLKKNGPGDRDHAPLGVVCHPKARTRHNLPACKIWQL